jgi:hypothetical protein
MRYSLRLLFALPIFLIVALFVIDYWPKSETLPIGAPYVGWYRGIGLAYGSGFLGKRFYKVQYSPTDPKDGVSHIYLHSDNDGYYSFSGFYDNGDPRESGRCFVRFDTNGVPEPDIHNVETGSFTSRDGNVKSTVTLGTGIQIYWNKDGAKIWELVLDKYARRRARMWNDYGQLVVDEQYDKAER